MTDTGRKPLDSELIERLEKATGPDRELDEAIARANNYKLACPATGGYQTWFDPDGNYIGSAPRFTASLDAALTLVPEGAYWKVGKDHQDDGPVGYYASVRSPRFSTSTATPAIALCIAALKARGGSQ